MSPEQNGNIVDRPVSGGKYIAPAADNLNPRATRVLLEELLVSIQSGADRSVGDVGEWNDGSS